MNLRDQVHELSKEKKRIEAEINLIVQRKEDFFNEGRIQGIEEGIKNYIDDGFEAISRQTQRDIIERIIPKVIIKKSYEIEVKVAVPFKKNVTVEDGISTKVQDGGPGPGLSKLLKKIVERLIITGLPPNLLLSSKRFLHEQYVKNSLSANQIAELIGSSKSGVLDALKRHDIPVREPHRPHGRPSQTRFGQRKVKGRVRSHQKEQTAIAVIRQLRAEGMSLRKIAEVLQEMGVKTKNKGRKWHPEMVRRILAVTQ